MLQLGSNPVSYMEGKPRKPVVPDSIKVVLTYAKRHTDAEAWESALKNAQDLTKKWLKLRAKVEFWDVRPPTRIAVASDTLQVIVFVPVSARTALFRASGLDCIFVCQFIDSDQDRAIYKAVPMSVDATLSTCIGQAQFLGENAFGVVSYGAGFGIQVKSLDFDEILSLLKPQKREQFICKTWEISGLPVAMGKGSLQAFLGEWKVHPLHTFRQGFRRTWIVRAAQQPLETVIYNDFGLAVIKEASPRRSHPNMERLQAPRPDRSIPFVREKESNYQKPRPVSLLARQTAVFRRNLRQMAQFQRHWHP